MVKSPITCHVLDSSSGKPAQGVQVTLDLLDGPSDQTGSSTTDVDGRVSNLLHPSATLEAGIYKMTFHTGPYFEALATQTFYPFVEITFALSDPTQHYHIPLLISPFSYTTYRGS
ncbi:hypothetical protein BCR39DRAFT_470543 [Naematelia encephala]|uniref:5-hydroxyisourate hydrolase n=1 Tax=Naematelia encephala TaxID=71784 RepID=A0A1Y2AVF4_9TREE|nr:hypothetical protein BCR39DRAFT_470543 [Naematelia encephala]